MEIKVTSGQGITQAIASNLGLSKDDCKKINLSTWQSVMTLVDEANTKRVNNNESSIFTGGNDVKSIGDKSTWKSNFMVHNGQVLQIEDSVFDKIKSLLGVAGAKDTAEAKASEKSAETGETTASVQDKKSVEPQKSSEAGTTEKVQSESVKKGEEIHNKFKEMGEFDENGNVKKVELEIVGDDWRELAGKKDKTADEVKQLDTQYINAMKAAGSAYTDFIDSKFGNGDGVLEKSEYFAFEEDGVPEELKSDEEAMKEVNQMKENEFRHLDLNKDGKLDKDEISAYFNALDFGTEEGQSNGMNGKISAYDFMVNSLDLSKEKLGSLKQKLAYAYEKLTGKKPAADD